MKRSPDSSCSSPSSSAGSSTITVPDQQIPEKPIKIKRSRKTQKLQSQSQCRNKSPAATTTSATARRSSIYRGVTRHRWTGRFEAHLWDKSSWNNIQNKKGRQVYLGAYDSEEAAAHTYDLAALKYWGPETTLNFPIETYATEVEEMKRASKEEYLASLRRRSSGFSRGVSKYRGVARHHHNGRWEARIGRVFGNKYLYLGTYNTQEEAAAAYDMAAIEHRGPNAVTNFDISNYIDRMKDKGLLLPHIAQEQSSSEQSGEEEAEVDQKPHHGHQGSQEAEPGNVEREHQEEEKQKEGEMVHELDQYQQMMSPCNMDEHELSWSFCMDAGGFSPLPLPNNLLQGELPDPFEDSGFEDNIDFIFDSTYRSDALLLSSSPSSTTTLVSCNYNG